MYNPLYEFPTSIPNILSISTHGLYMYMWISLKLGFFFINNYLVIKKKKIKQEHAILQSVCEKKNKNASSK